MRLTHLDIAWRSNQAGHPRTGTIVPRHQQTAVARNRLRRRLREILRRDVLPGLTAVDLVIRPRRSAYDAVFADLRAEMTEAARRIP